MVPIVGHSILQLGVHMSRIDGGVCADFAKHLVYCEGVMTNRVPPAEHRRELMYYGSFGHAVRATTRVSTREPVISTRFDCAPSLG